ncbi:hypothetical protein ACFSTD_17900 [Novosphingobium colocasiae]
MTIKPIVIMVPKIDTAMILATISKNQQHRHDHAEDQPLARAQAKAGGDADQRLQADADHSADALRRREPGRPAEDDYSQHAHRGEYETRDAAHMDGTFRAHARRKIDVVECQVLPPREDYRAAGGRVSWPIGDSKRLAGTGPGWPG